MEARKLLQADVWIAREPRDVYRFVCDFENYPEWFPGIRQMKSADERPPGTVGKRYAEIAWVPPGREEAVDVEVVSVRPDEELVIQASLEPLRPRFHYLFESEDGGCRFRWMMYTHGSGPLIGLARILTRKVLRGRSAGAMENLKDIMEREPAASQVAAVQRRYGPIREVLKLSRYVRRPSPEEGEVLVRQQASSVNHIDLGRIHGYGRRVFERSGANAFPMTVGQDVAGVIESIASDVEGLEVGQQVFGLKPPGPRGAHAEYVTVPAAFLRPLPDGLHLHHAAAIPYVGATACIALRKAFPDLSRQVEVAGKRLLVQGAAGGVGAAAAQIAASLGAKVTGVVLDHQREAVSPLSLERVVSPTELADLPTEYDFSLQTTAHDTDKLAGRLREGGALMTTVSPMLASIDEHGLLRGAVRAKGELRRLKSRFAADGIDYDWVFFEPDPSVMEVIATLADRGMAMLPIASVYPFAEIHSAYARQADPALTGKVVLTFGSES